MTEPFELGKLPAEVLGPLLAANQPKDPRVIVGPGVGLDCAVLDIGDRYLVAKTDPITFATDRIGWYAVHVNANDIATTGGAPRWFLATVLLPEGRATAQLAEDIFSQIVEACESIGANLVGGHTEITYGIDRPLVMGCLLGEVEKDRLVTAAGAQVGDAIMLTQGIPIEGTSIIAQEKGDELSDRFDHDFLARCRNFLFDPGISVVEAASAATGAGEVHAMHDPTEGGLATGLWELAEASSTELEVVLEAIHLFPEGKAMCEAFGLDPMGCIASGALLFTAAQESVDAIQAELESRSIPSSVIGRVVADGEPAVRLASDPDGPQLVKPPRDEIAKLFE